MIEYLFTSFILCIFIVLILRTVVLEARKVKNFRSRLFFCLALTIIFKYDWGIIFYGLEYEDAYIFTACARAFTYGVYPNSFLIDGITIGSLSSPLEMLTVGGHFILYPVYLSYFINIFGYSPTIISFANAIIAFFVLLLLSVFPCSKRSEHIWTVGPVVYCIAPIINVFCNTHLAETFSSLICMFFLFEFLKLFDKPQNKQIIICSFLLFVAIFTKRENLVLFIAPLIFSIHHFVAGKKKNAFLMATMTLSVTIIYFIFIQNVFLIEAHESESIKASTFSLDYFRLLLPVFLSSILNFSFFTVIFFVFAVSIAYKPTTIDIKFLIIVLILISYFIIYSSHYRSYYFVENLNASEFETFRYINNFFYLFSVIIAYKLCITRVKPGKILFIIYLSVLLLAIFYTFNSRIVFSKDEYAVRLSDVEQIIKFISNKKNSILVSDRSFIYQLYADEHFNTCDITCIDSDYLNNFTYIFFENKSQDYSYLIRRYGIYIDKQEFNPVMFFDGNVLYRIR